jgi:hypothetical protein
VEFINQHSFLLAGLAALGLLAFLLLRDGVSANDLVALGSLLLGFVLAYALLQPGPGADLTADQVTNQIRAGRPVLLEFQSPY